MQFSPFTFHLSPFEIPILNSSFHSKQLVYYTVTDMVYMDPVNNSN